MDANGKVEYVSDVYPLWLHADDLKGKAVTVKIARVDLEVFHTPGGKERPALVLSFEKAKRRLILNKTQANALVRVLGTERLAEWPGKAVTLAPGQAPNGKQTIIIKEASNGHVQDHEAANAGTSGASTGDALSVGERSYDHGR